ncbi:procollagen-lysine,2-oxoglutarate 5-dioxygenase 1 isoform X2 [Lingula anatina]|uniref:procollagen-lysine 5-dioxygenase n=1 Tax=Lingula anatina TaxID=7574 RepID=A0A1S3I3I1_LINAN|nr:procollagen-lysine,2-oxoglutarate 5-dioxygenase 1 isoform X2 [Lingula anatina]|eukprot:XP_013392391.1 procollagen-lysine,2-oxoglutarate 5-dioxygenase 1 isoform X2 [Lingula anatina]
MALISRLFMVCLPIFFVFFPPWSSPSIGVHSSSVDDGLLLVTVASDETDGFKRYMRSANKYGLDVEVLGMGKEWRGGDMAVSVGGGYKINLLKEGLKKYKDKKDLVLMFTDSYDVIFTGGAQEILKMFKKFNARVVFSAEGFCWPDASLMDKYPEVKMNEKRFLNSGGYIGYAPDIYEIITHNEVGDKDDDQLVYTNIFLDENLRKKWNIKLDTRGEIFQNLNGALDEVTLKFKGANSYLYNVKTGTTPLVVHGNGPIKHRLDGLGNYLADSWTPTHGCLACKEDYINLGTFKEQDYPTVFVGVFIDQPVPFIAEFFEKLAGQQYPKKKMDVFVYNNANFHAKDVKNFMIKYEKKYNSFTSVPPERGVNAYDARNMGIDHCLKKNCQYYLFLEPEAHLDNSKTLQLLIEQNRSVIAPMFTRPGKLWSNFWGSLSSNGFYARSEDYLDIVNSHRIGLWNVPYVRYVYLIQGNKIKQLQGGYRNDHLDHDMAICKTMRDKNMFMYVSNQLNYGHLIDGDNYDTTRTHPDMYEMFSNPMDWEKKYIHENYSRVLMEEYEVDMPCPDVYWFPVLSETFCQHLIEEMEGFGQWSNGKNEDSRLDGGYENVPTRDIHMNQVGFERHWLHFLRVYVQPVQQKVFVGYYHDPPHAVMNFVVRYRPDEQPSLRPHHDSSTYTINIALNTPGVDYEGGGVRFVRQNCSVTQTKRGWGLISPGRLTHLHEGLTVTKGTRYIMISFVDP